MIRPAPLGLTLLAAIAAALPAARPVQAQPQEPPGAPRAFVTLRGADTLVVERAERQADGSVLSRFTLRGAAGPAAGTRFAATFAPGPDARVRQATIEVTPPGASAPAQRATLTFAGHGDSVLVAVERGPSQTLAAAPGALPYVNLSIANLELVLRRARVLARTTQGLVTVPLFAPGAPPITASVTRVGADSALVSLGGTPVGVEVRIHTGPDDRILGLRVPAQGLVTVAADPRTVSALGPPPAPHAGPSYAAPGGAPYTAEEVRVPTPGGFSLAGTLTLPRDARGPAPVVVTITGSGPEDRDEAIPGIAGYAPFRQIADTLGRRGVGVLRLDDRGVGASGGRFAGSTSRDFADDVRAALAYLRARAAERGDVDARRLALLGHSEGGLIAPMVAADDPSVAALVLLAGPAYTGQRVSEFQQRETIATRVPEAQRALAYEANQPGVRAELARNPWLRFWWAYDPLPAARRVRTPVLILQGATDHQVPPEQADTLAAAFRAGGDRDVTVRVFPATDHLFLADPSGAPAGYAALPSKAVRPEVLGAVAGWLAARLAH